MAQGLLVDVVLEGRAPVDDDERDALLVGLVKRRAGFDVDLAKFERNVAANLEEDRLRFLVQEQSSSAAARARCMLRASRETSRASGPNRLASGTSGGGTGRPVRSPFVHSDIFAIGRVTLLFTTISAMIETTSESARNRIALYRHRSHSALSR